LAFDLIQRSVAYLKTILGPDRPSVTITIASNGTILTEEILSFLIEHKVLFQFSIDGDKEIHDRNRRFKSGNHGSHDLVKKNLQRIYDTILIFSAVRKSERGHDNADLRFCR